MVKQFLEMSKQLYLNLKKLWSNVEGFIKEDEKEEALIDRIKYDGSQNGSPWLVYKYPGETFVLGSQLIVNQGQEALFFKGGKALDLFGAGTHTLLTGNLPLLNKLANLPFGGDTPFTAEI